MMRRASLLLILVICSFAHAPAQKRAFTVEDLYRIKNLSDLHLSPDGRTLVFAVTTVTVNALLYRDLTPRALLFTLLCFIFFAATAAAVGNWFSIRFPKRLEFGKRMNASGATGLLLLPIFLCIAAVPALAVLAGWAARSLLIEYAILAAFAAVGVGVYFLSLVRQGRRLAERELDILEAVTGRGGDD